MAIGARDAIDKKLAAMYADKQTNNFDITSKVDPELVWQGMKMIAINNRAMINFNNARIAKRTEKIA